VTPADDRRESIDTMRGLITGTILGGLVLAAPLLVILGWVAR
jgi:hypothetical protein